MVVRLQSSVSSSVSSPGAVLVELPDLVVLLQYSNWHPHETSSCDFMFFQKYQDCQEAAPIQFNMKAKINTFCLPASAIVLFCFIHLWMSGLFYLFTLNSVPGCPLWPPHRKRCIPTCSMHRDLEFLFPFLVHSGFQLRHVFFFLRSGFQHSNYGVKSCMTRTIGSGAILNNVAQKLNIFTAGVTSCVGQWISPCRSQPICRTAARTFVHCKNWWVGILSIPFTNHSLGITAFTNVTGELAVHQTWQRHVKMRSWYLLAIAAISALNL